MGAGLGGFGILALVNEERTSIGLNPINVDDDLNTLAEKWASVIAEKGASTIADHKSFLEMMQYVLPDGSIAVLNINDRELGFDSIRLTTEPDFIQFGGAMATTSTGRTAQVMFFSK